MTAELLLMNNKGEGDSAVRRMNCVHSSVKSVLLAPW